MSIQGTTIYFSPRDLTLFFSVPQAGMKKILSNLPILNRSTFNSGVTLLESYILNYQRKNKTRAVEFNQPESEDDIFI